MGDELFQARTQPLAHRLDMIEEAGLEDHVEHRLARRHRQRVAAIGRAVGAEHHALGRLFGREARAQRKVAADPLRSEEHTSELQSLMRISYAVFCLKKKKKTRQTASITGR